jgi:hypothetical protein
MVIDVDASTMTACAEPSTSRDSDIARVRLSRTTADVCLQNNSTAECIVAFDDNTTYFSFYTKHHKWRSPIPDSPKR